MRITIHQPDFLPWIGFFHKWAVSDLLIIHDNIQYIKQGWQNRDKIKINNSDKWITVPVITKGRSEQNINEVEIVNNNKWKKTILGTLRTFFSKSKNINEYFSELEEIILKEHKLLIDLNMELIYWVGRKLKIEVPIRFASDNKLDTDKTEKLIELLKAYNADEYYTGLASKDYLNEELFTQNGIKLTYQNIDEISNYYPVSNELINYSVIQYLFNEHAY
jgi:hypothetical protein